MTHKKKKAHKKDWPKEWDYHSAIIGIEHIIKCENPAQDPWGTDFFLEVVRSRIDIGFSTPRLKKQFQQLDECRELRRIIPAFSERQHNHILSYFVAREFVLYTPADPIENYEDLPEWVLNGAPIFRVAQAVRDGNLKKDFTRLDLVQWGEGAGLELTEEGYNELREAEQLQRQEFHQAATLQAIQQLSIPTPTQSAPKKPAFNPKTKEERKTLEKAQSLNLNEWANLYIEVLEPDKDMGTLLWFKKLSGKRDLVYGFVNKLNRTDHDRQERMHEEDSGNAPWHFLFNMVACKSRSEGGYWEAPFPQDDTPEATETLYRRHKNTVSTLNRIFRGLFGGAQGPKGNPFKTKKREDGAYFICELGGCEVYNRDPQGGSHKTKPFDEKKQGGGTCDPRKEVDARIENEWEQEEHQRAADDEAL
jgi:hypothetical protein